MFQSSRVEVAPLTDSVWFWVMLFSIAALASLAASKPVYDARQDRIERRFQVRAAVGFPSSRVGTPGAQADQAALQSVEIAEGRLIGLAPIASVVLATLVGSSIMLYCERRGLDRLRSNGADSAAPGKSPHEFHS